MNRKDLKKKGKKVFKKHYLFFVLILVIASFIGNQYSSSTGILDNFSQASSISVQEESNINDETNNQEIDNSVIKENDLNNNEKKHDKGIFGKSDGVFAKVVNAFSSKSIYKYLVDTVSKVIGSKTLAGDLLIIVAGLFIFSIWFLYINTFSIIVRRIFIEGRIYDNIHKQKFVFLIKAKKVLKTSKAMFRYTAYLTLWELTIIGGLIKRYSYYMVPYILAENPDITGKEAILLSRKMMDGHKWECFKLEFSFIGWFILEIFTFGLSGIFYSNPYQMSTMTEYFYELRKLAIKNKLDGYEVFNDKYLYEKASKELLDETYSDVIQKTENGIKEVKLSKTKEFFVNTFGINLMNKKDSDTYNNNQINSVIIATYNNEIQGSSYPTRLFTIKEEDQLKNLSAITYLKPYSIEVLILIFFIFSFVGWSWEVSLHLIEDGVFVNRGTKYGPWLPIYGFGGILILIFLYKFRKKPLVEFITAIVLCGIVEYFTSFYLEIAHNGQKWWNYTGYFLNLNGRICAEGLLVFGLGGVAAVYIFAPILDNKLRKIPRKIMIIISVVLCLLFLVDSIISSKYPNTGKGITDYCGIIETENIEMV